jgi:bifunctional non-homologous end joining protein LigD
MGLQTYNSKRNFKKTPEPRGKKARSLKTGLRFVVQKHDASRLHYDFRLEMGGTLKSWAVPKGPSLNPDDKRLAMEVEDHPLKYRTFEGIIPEGNYGGGTVMVWDQGTYHSSEPASGKKEEEILLEGWRKGNLKFRLDGKKLHGEFALVRMKPGRGKNAWLLLKKADPFSTQNAVEKLDKSVLTGRSLQQIEKNAPSEGVRSRSQTLVSQTPQKAIPSKFIRPMLATLVDKPFSAKGWLFETKWDGYRAIAEIKGKKVRLYSRNEKSFNETYAPVVEALKSIGHDCVLDGEIVVLGPDGRSSFQLLQQYQKKPEGILRYCVFDLLFLDGEDIRSFPLRERKKLLSKLIKKLKAKEIIYSDHVVAEGKEIFKKIRSQGLEGLMAKNCDSPYSEGVRTRNWLKIKTHLRQEAVIGGFTAPQGSRRYFGSLILGVYEEKNFVYVGHTGTGFDHDLLKTIYSKLKPLAIPDCPFQKCPKPNSPVTWVEPKLVCEVSFQEWTDDKIMRQPSFEGLRVDKSARNVHRENELKIEDTPVKQPRLLSPESKAKKAKPAPEEIEGVEITHPDKVFWPEEGYTKLDVARYYQAIAPILLPYLKDRPQSLHRHPNGIQDEGFFQKDVTGEIPSWIKTATIHSESNDKEIQYLLCQNIRSLMYMANLGCIELNPWNSRIKKINNPDYLVIDLDPEGIGFEKVIETAQTVHRLLDKIGAASLCKTSGATGLHIAVPLAAKYTYDQAKQFTELLVNFINRELPMTTSILRNPKKRQHRIYLDFLQNRKGQTISSPYCIRPRPHAPVSTPLHWREVKRGLSPTDFTIKNTLKRLEKVGDLWQPILGEGIDLPHSLQILEKMTNLSSQGS